MFSFLFFYFFTFTFSSPSMSSSTDNKNFKRYTEQLKEVGLIDGRGHVLPDESIRRRLGFDTAATNKFLDMKKARAAIMDRRAKARAKKAYEDAKRKAEDDEESSSKRTKKDDSSSSSSSDDESSSSSEPDIKLSATPPDEETTEACMFCGEAECELCAHMCSDLDKNLFLIRVCAVRNHQVNPAFRMPELTVSRASYLQMANFAGLGGQKVLVTEIEFEQAGNYKDCRYCGCLLTGPSAVIKTKGPVTYDNLVPCCMLCSMIKVDIPDEKFLVQCKRIVDHSRKCPVPCNQPFLDGTQMCADHYYGLLPEKKINTLSLYPSLFFLYS